MLKKKETKQRSVPKSSSGGVSYQTQTSSSSYSSQTNVQRIETKTYVTHSATSLPTTSSFTLSTFENKGTNGQIPSAISSKSSKPRSIFDFDVKPLSTNTSVSQSSSFQSRYSPAYSSLPSNKRQPLESAVFSKYALSSPPTNSLTTPTTSENKRPDEKRPSLLPSSRPRTIFDTDARPFSSTPIISQSSGYQSISRNPNSSIAPSTNRSTNEFSQNRDPVIPTYKTDGKKRGKALIINNVKFMEKEEERQGALVDEKRISDLFKNIGFDVKAYRNLKKSEMNAKINKYTSDRSLEKVDISVVIMMSHGHNIQNGEIVRGGYTEIVGIDGESLPIDDVLSRFDTKNCSALTGKPKIFFFQCCRGHQEEIQVDAAPIRNVIKQHADMLIAFSTLPGFFSLRDPVRGSWYIQSVCDVFERHAKVYDVESLLKIVDEQLSKKHPQYKQTSSYESRGFKRCFLNPPS